MKNIFLLLLCIHFALILTAHPWKPANYIIVDTDGGIDDMRALTLLLSSSSVQVLAITTSAGAVDAETNYWKVKSLLQQYNHQGVLVGLNNNIKRKSDFLKAHNLAWGDSVMVKPHPPVDYQVVLNQVFTYCNEPVAFVCLGSLNTVATYLKMKPQANKRITEVLWAVSENLTESYNYKIDSGSYNNLISQSVALDLLKIPVNNFSYNNEIVAALSENKNKYIANYIRNLSGNDSHFSGFIYDEFVAMHLFNHELVLSELNTSKIAQILSAMLNQHAVDKNQVFSSFPNDTSQYYTDIANKMAATIAKFGQEEWSACVITNELHRHVGIYALVGAKMGIRAREYFNCGADELNVTTFVGSEPPISCMNDGIQTSTGATVGHGLIHVSDNPVKVPKAVFEYLGNKVAFELKPEYKLKVQRDVKQLVSLYGLSNDVYWELLREIALNVWFSWDRHEIFIITPLE